MFSVQYVAGLFDGEGNVEITPKYALRIRLGNTYKPVVIQLYKQYGGNLSCTNVAQAKRRNWKVGYIWAASGETARRVLTLIEPYTVIKRAQIQLGLQIVPHIRGVKITEEEQVERTALRTAIQILNKRGTIWGDKSLDEVTKEFRAETEDV